MESINGWQGKYQREAFGFVLDKPHWSCFTMSNSFFPQCKDRQSGHALAPVWGLNLNIRPNVIRFLPRASLQLCSFLSSSQVQPHNQYTRQNKYILEIKILKSGDIGYDTASYYPPSDLISLARYMKKQRNVIVIVICFLHIQIFRNAYAAKIYQKR